MGTEDRIVEYLKHNKDWNLNGRLNGVFFELMKVVIKQKTMYLWVEINTLKFPFYIYHPDVEDTIHSHFRTFLSNYFNYHKNLSIIIASKNSIANPPN
jgi:hypothetical protein